MRLIILFITLFTYHSLTGVEEQILDETTELPESYQKKEAAYNLARNKILAKASDSLQKEQEKLKKHTQKLLKEAVKDGNTSLVRALNEKIASFEKEQADKSIESLFGEFVSEDIVVEVLTKDVARTSTSNFMAESDRSGGLTHSRGWIEYEVKLNSGKQYVHVLYAGQESRPCSLIVNGKVVTKTFLTATTGSWNSDTLKWFTYGPFEFKQDVNIVRIDPEVYAPHLKKIAFTTSEQLPEKVKQNKE